MLNLILRPGMVHKLKEHIYSFVNIILKLVIRLLMLHVELNLVDFLYLLPLIKESSTTCYISKTSNRIILLDNLFLISSELHTAGKNSFYSNLMKISEYFNFGNFSPDLVDTAKVTMFLQLMKQKYISYWQHTLQHSQKLEFYRSFKNEYATSSYLELTRRVSDRRTLTKLRISNHKLMIELGRYNDTPRDNRLCPVCDCNQTEDEIHFLFYCSKYATTRDNFYKKIQPFIQNVSRLPVSDLILELMNSSIFFVNMQFIKFISSCFDSRNKMLSM